VHRLIGAALAEIKHLYQDQGTRTVSLDVLKLHHGEDVQLEYPGDTDLLAYEPGAELREIPVPILTENPGRTDEEVGIEARERIPIGQQQLSLPRCRTQDESQSNNPQEPLAANPEEEENSEMSEVEPGHRSIIQWEDSWDTGVETPCTGGKTAATKTHQSEQSIPTTVEARTETGIEGGEMVNPTLSTKYADKPEGNTGWILDLPEIQREAKRRHQDPDWEPYLPQNKSYKEGRRYDGDKRKFDQDERPKSKMAKNEEQYWRGEKRRDPGSSEEEEGAMNPKRVRGKWTGDKEDEEEEDDESLINNIQTGGLTTDKGSVSQLHSRNKVVPKTRTGIWETMKSLLSGGQGGLRPGSSEAKIAENQKKRNLLKNHGTQDKATGY